MTDLFIISFLSRTLDFFSFCLSLWNYLWLAETCQQPISQTTWLKATPHCNQCNHSLSFWAYGFICGWPRPVSSRSAKQPGWRSPPIVTIALELHITGRLLPRTLTTDFYWLNSQYIQPNDLAEGHPPLESLYPITGSTGAGCDEEGMWSSTRSMWSSTCSWFIFRKECSLVCMT